MPAVRTLVAFAAALLLVFGAALAAGDLLGPERDGARAASGHGAGDGMGGHDEPGGRSEADPVRGLAVAGGGLRLVLERTHLPRGTTAALRFRIVDGHGAPVRDFQVQHEKRLHLILARRDASGFRHLHPTMAPDGTWTARVSLPDPGAYRVFADFQRDGKAETLAADAFVDGPATYRPLPAPATTAAAGDGYRVRLADRPLRAGREATLRFTVTRHGAPVRPEPYLGARGHLVALREGDLAYLHVHPEGDSVAFMTTLPTPGRYRLFLQFKHEGRVHTAAFTAKAGR